MMPFLFNCYLTTIVFIILAQTESSKMIKQAKTAFFKIYAFCDAHLKFPNLKKGEVAIQIGFDMSSAITSDLFGLHKKTKTKGLVIGIDPDPNNHLDAKKIIDKNSYNIQLIQKATYSESGETILRTGRLSSWNQIENVPQSNKHLFNGVEYKAEMDTVDNIIEEHETVKTEQISHINITNNGAEYATLKGMHNTLTKAKNISITVIAGRKTIGGVVNGMPDYKAITDLLNTYGFKCKFKRMNNIFWWGVITKLLINRKWIFNEEWYGVVFAYKGNKKTKWYQSYS